MKSDYCWVRQPEGIAVQATRSDSGSTSGNAASATRGDLCLKQAPEAYKGRGRRPDRAGDEV